VPDRDTSGLERLLAERGDDLMRAAIALTGSRPEGEDLLQAALERLLRSWHRVDDPEAYLRRTLYNLAADDWRRRGRWRSKLPLLRDQHREPPPDATDTVDLRDALVRAMHQLPRHQRVVIVLRYWEQLTEAQTAELLGCSEGAVKSAASRGMRRLRELTRAWHDAEPPVGTAACAGIARTAAVMYQGPAVHQATKLPEGRQ
jgi:RNA polymerase sigma-70 factor (sigma-E family)